MYLGSLIGCLGLKFHLFFIFVKQFYIKTVDLSGIRTCIVIVDHWSTTTVVRVPYKPDGLNQTWQMLSVRPSGQVYKVHCIVC